MGMTNGKTFQEVRLREGSASTRHEYTTQWPYSGVSRVLPCVLHVHSGGGQARSSDKMRDTNILPFVPLGVGRDGDWDHPMHQGVMWVLDPRNVHCVWLRPARTAAPVPQHVWVLLDNVCRREGKRNDGRTASSGTKR